jgi:hypothetical protein
VIKLIVPISPGGCSKRLKSNPTMIMRIPPSPRCNGCYIFNKLSNIKFEKTRASIVRKVGYVYSISQKGGYHAAR